MTQGAAIGQLLAVGIRILVGTVIDAEMETARTEKELEEQGEVEASVQWAFGT